MLGLTRSGRRDSTAKTAEAENCKRLLLYLLHVLEASAMFLKFASVVASITQTAINSRFIRQCRDNCPQLIWPLDSSRASALFDVAW